MHCVVLAFALSVAAAAPVETRPPNAAGQRPAFAGQTRAPAAPDSEIAVTLVAQGLDLPWGIALLDDGRILVTERTGSLRIVAANGAVSAAVEGVPAVHARDQGGLLDVAIGPDGLVYLSYAEERPGGTGTTVARGRLRAGPKPVLDDVQVVFRQQPSIPSTKHYGSRLLFDGDGNLLVTLGERYEAAEQAQDLSSHLGKIVRIRPDGGVPPTNPFVGRADARPEIWSYGHRNVQSAAFHPSTGELWIVEHGAKGGDEVNLVRAGRNYGWPVIAYGLDYSGAKIGEGLTAKAGMEQPLYYWDPVIAPSGMVFVTSTRFPGWQGNLLVGGLAGQHLARLVLDGERVVGEERLLEEREQRIRDVQEAPDGAIYVVTDEPDGELLRLTPAAPARETAAAR